MSEKTNHSVPDPRAATCFRFLGSSYDPENGVARLSYAFDDGPELVERITFPHAPSPPEASRQAGFARALEILHLVAGVSYYKAGLSRKIEVPEPGLPAGVSAFMTELYVQGLGELGYLNKVSIDDRVRFPFIDAAGEQPSGTARPLILPERALVAMGGGKDSLVGLELMQKAGIELMPVCVGGSSLIEDTVRAAGLPMIRIGRQLAPELAGMNRAGAWNGHIPVTAINSAILLCAAILYGFRYIVFSNERSADEATLVTPKGVAVNHQFSKSSAFESAFRDVIASQISPDIEYFSVLRPYSELGIVQRFSEMKKFHPVFSSCNRNFHLDGPRVSGRWCRNCPKCRFAALSLALFLSPDEVTAIQGGDMLNDPDQEQGFRALCGLGTDKPFECIGEAGESRAALMALAKRAPWRRHAVVRALLSGLNQVEVPALDELLRPSGLHFIPAPVLVHMNLHGRSARRTAILGLGREGQAAWRYLRAKDPDRPLTLVAEAAPDPDFVKLLSAQDHVVTGPLSEAGLDRFDIMVRSPGISRYRDSLQRALAAGTKITTPSNMWFESHQGQRTICITGTKGKSTTSALLAHMLESCGYRTRLAGNIGRPLLDCNDRNVDWWVIELSSFQLADLEATPAVSVILNLSPEHLDWHRTDENYRRDKLRLASLAGRRPLVVNAADPVLAETFSGRENAIWFNGSTGIRVRDGRLLKDDAAIPLNLPASLPGVHNLSNIAAAFAVLETLGVDLGAAAQSIASFRGLPHRLQVVGEKAGIRFINDSIASTPVATVAALEAFSGQDVTLLLGGLDRGLDWEPYTERIKTVIPRAVIGMPDNGPKIVRTLRQAKIDPEYGLHEVDGLEAAVKLAKRLTEQGGVVLLSPGAPSFPQFIDYRDRGRRFSVLSGFDCAEWEMFSET